MKKLIGKISASGSLNHSANGKLRLFAERVMAIVEPGFRGQLTQCKSEGSKPWDFQGTVTVEHSGCGFTLEETATAFDTPHGANESVWVRMTSFGLPDGASLHVSYSSHYASPNPVIEIDCELAEEDFEAVYHLAVEQFGAF